MSASILDLARRRVVLLDGALGTELMHRGLPQGVPPEIWNVERPDVVRAVHRDYFAAGSDAVSTSSFGGSRLKLEAYGLGERCVELNRAAAANATAVRPEGKYVAGSMGPTGRFLEPQGDVTPALLEAAFTDQARGLAEGGVDLFIVETQYDLREALSALRAVRAVAPGRPVLVTLTFNATPRGYFTMMGDPVGPAFEELEKAGADAVGANCQLDSAQMAGLAKTMAGLTSLPLVVQANSGQPSLGPDGRMAFGQSVDDYLRHVPEILAAGVRFLGGCCGTTPETVRRMAALLGLSGARAGE